MRVEFKLDMPDVASWNGRWSGAGKDYLLVSVLSKKQVEDLQLPNSWYHNFGDGWGASVSARVMEKGERKRKSAGFCGYEWMVSRILRWGDTTCRCEWAPDPNYPGEERCRLCRTSRKIKTEE